MLRELYLDSANIDEIKLLVQTDAIQGVTTNPSLMAKEAKGGYTQRLSEICDVLAATNRKMHLSVEVITSDPNEMASQAIMLVKALKNPQVDLHVKIPVMLETLSVISDLRNQNIKVNATACMTALQAKLAEDAGAAIVSFFYNRIKDADEEPDDALAKYSRLRRSSRVICGSIRKPDDVYRSWLNGADIVTASLKVIKDMISHPQTDKAISQFQKDIDTWLK